MLLLYLRESTYAIFIKWRYHLTGPTLCQRWHLNCRFGWRVQINPSNPNFERQRWWPIKHEEAWARSTYLCLSHIATTLRHVHKGVVKVVRCDGEGDLLVHVHKVWRLLPFLVDRGNGDVLVLWIFLIFLLVMCCAYGFMKASVWRPLCAIWVTSVHE